MFIGLKCKIGVTTFKTTISD